MSHGQPHLARDKLAEFLRDPRSIRQFEILFEIAEEVGLGGLDAVNIAAENANSRAQQALDALGRIADVVEMIASAPPVMPEIETETYEPARDTATLDDVYVPTVQIGTMGEQQADRVAITGGVVTAQLRNNQTILLETTATLTNHAAGQIATLNNSPAIGNPTKWISINDNGVTRRIPTW